MYMKKDFRNSGIEIIGDVSRGTHLCQFYQTKKDLLDILIPYFRAGLENNEFCYLITSKPLEVDETVKALREVIPDFNVYMDKGQIEVVSSIFWCVDDIYDSERMFNGWLEKINYAFESGYNGLRLAGNISWVKKNEWENFIDFEKKIDSTVNKYPIITLCSYPIHRCHATKIIDIIINHHFALIKRKGKWENIESSKRKKAEEKIKILANVVESSDDAILTESLEGIITSWNKGAERIYGYSAEEMLGKNVLILEPDNIKGEIKRLIGKIKLGERVRHYETLRLKVDGTQINVSITLSPVFDTSGRLVAISSIARDVTERIKAEKLLTNAEAFRKKEIHHRIKNNLQVICSLLDLQSEKFRGKKVLDAFKESQNRVLSMSLIHEELYKGRGTDTLDFSEYLQRLAENLFQTYSLRSKNICLYVDLEDNAFLDMDTSVPLGIIVNELISNSLKHAYIKDEAGEIRIQLRREELNNKKEMNNELPKSLFSLTISDDGKGIPENINLEKLESLGLQLVNTLVDQLNGKIELKRAHGTEFKITFEAVERSFFL
jgi:PAS domain S-box-containing protein